MSKPKYIETPEKLWELFESYVNSLETITIEVPHVKLGTVKMDVKAPMTMEGFKTYGHTQGVTIDHYIKDSEGSYGDYRPIVTRIKERIFDHNFNRAAVGVYKENLIARQLGMTEKTENKNENNHSGTIKIEVVKSDAPLSTNEKDINLD